MKRRTLLGLATGVFSASLATGSGAFNTARSDREIEVNVVNDVEAYLRLNPIGTENKDGDVLGRSSNSGKQVRFQFPGTFEQINDVTKGDGLGTDSEYYFDNLIEIGNQGTNPIVVFTQSSGEITQVAIYDSNDPDRKLLTDKDTGLQLNTAKAFEAGIYINTTDMNAGERNRSTLTFSGVSTSK